MSTKFANKIALSMIATLGLVFSTGCSQDMQTGSEGPSGIMTSRSLAPIAGSMIVADATGTPIADATVMIGVRAGVPFPGNVLKSDANGIVVFPAQWTDAQPVTIEAPGFVRTTWLAQSSSKSPGGLVLPLRKKVVPQRLEFTGKTTGYPNLAKDKWVDVGVIFPALRRDQLASLQVTDLLSTEVDTMTVMGKSMDVPSNISIPTQDEKYFFTITLDKPIFRTYVKEMRTWKMVATHARFPIDEVVDDLRDGKSFFDVLNYFEFKGASVDDIAISTPSTKRDMAINKTKFDAQIDVAAPRFASNYTMLAVAVADNGGLLYPTDVKKLNPGQTRRLVTPKNTTGYIVGALRETSAPTSGSAADSLSAVIAPNNTTTRFEFLDLPRAPKIVGSTLMLEPPKASVSTVTQAVTYATLNKVDKISAGKSTLETKSPIWDVYSDGWTTSMELPDFAAATKGHRWEVLFGGAPHGTTVQLGPNIIDGLSHLSKSATDL